MLFIHCPWLFRIMVLFGLLSWISMWQVWSGLVCGCGVCGCVSCSVGLVLVSFVVWVWVWVLIGCWVCCWVGWVLVSVSSVSVRVISVMVVFIFVVPFVVSLVVWVGLLFG